MKKHILIFLFIATTLTGFAQEEVLFIGLYSKADAGKGYWCRDMDMIKKFVKTVAEAKQLEADFRKEYAKDNPIPKIFSNESVIIYDYQKKDNAFNCTYRVIAFSKGKTNDEARQAMGKEQDRIKKEFKSQPNELYSWTPSTTKVEEIKIENDGFEEKYKIVTRNGKTSAIAGFFKNNNTDVALEIVITTSPESDKNPINPKLEEGSNPKSKSMVQKYTIEPGGRLQMQMDIVNKFSVEVYKVPKGKEEELNMYKKTKMKIREWIIKDGNIEPNRPDSGIRG